VTWGVRSVRGTAFLEDAVRWRQQCILVLTWAKPQEPLYRAMEGVLGAIDGLAEVVSRWQAAVPPAEPALARAEPIAGWRGRSSISPASQRNDRPPLIELERGRSANLSGTSPKGRGLSQRLPSSSGMRERNKQRPRGVSARGL
jgi:hypothetical protein